MGQLHTRAGRSNRLMKRTALLESLEQRTLLSVFFSNAINIGDTGTDNGVAVASDLAGGRYAVGTFRGTVDFDPSSAAFTMTSPASTPAVYIARYGASGN